MRDSFIAKGSDFAVFLQNVVPKIIPIGLAVTGVVLLYVWLSADAAMELTERLAIAENVPEMLPDESGVEQLRGQLIQFDGEPADLPGAWPRFRGANFDAISTDDIALARTWPTDGPG